MNCSATAIRHAAEQVMASGVVADYPNVDDRFYAQMTDDIDMNCGDIVNAGVSIQDKGRMILDMVLGVASGSAPRARRSA